MDGWTDVWIDSRSYVLSNSISVISEPPVAHWVKRLPTDLGNRVRSPLEAKSSQP